MSSRKPTLPQDRQLIVYYYQLKQSVVTFVGELTFSSLLLKLCEKTSAFNQTAGVIPALLALLERGEDTLHMRRLAGPTLHS